MRYELRQWISMASNFTFSFHQTSDSLHMKLHGDLDGSSACEIINALKNYRKSSSKIFIHTNYLSTIHPFGKDVFQKNLSTFNKKYNNIRFTGKHKNHFSL